MVKKRDKNSQNQDKNKIEHKKTLSWNYAWLHYNERVYTPEIIIYIHNKEYFFNNLHYMMFIYYYHANFTSLVIESFIISVNIACIEKRGKQSSKNRIGRPFTGHPILLLLIYITS